MLLLTVTGKPLSNVTFGTDFYIYSPYLGSNLGNTFTLNLGINFYGSITTKHGNFDIQAGGISWYRQSPLTVWSAEAYQRNSLFERVPWEVVSKTPAGRYSQYYNQGSVTQDDRFGRRAFQGISLNAHGLPKNFSFQGIIGKMQNNVTADVNDFAFGGRLGKKFTKPNLTLGYNHFTSSTQSTRVESVFSYDTIVTPDTLLLDSTFQRFDTTKIWGQPKLYSIHTLEFNWLFKGIKVWGEVGMGKYTSPNQQLPWGEGIMLRVNTPARFTGIPLEFMFYQLSPSFVNVNAAFLNTSVLEVLPNIGGVGATLLTPFGGPMTDLGFATNNRRGASINGEVKAGKFKFNGGVGFSHELQRSVAQISFNHRINGLQISRFGLFASNFGAYGRMNSYYRGVFEVVNITDTTASGDANFTKYFGAADFQAKFSNTIFKKKFYAYFLSTFNSVQPKFIPVPIPTKLAFIRLWHNELDLYYEVHPKLVVLGYAGVEMVKGNEFTDIDNTEILPGYQMSNLPRNQLNMAFGGGLDFSITKNAAMYLRYRWYSFEDKSFSLDKWRGSETTLEVKVYF